MEDEFFNDGILFGISNIEMTEVGEEGVNPGRDGEEEVGFMDAGVDGGVEVKTEELRAGRDGEGVCELGFEDTSRHVGDLLHRRLLPVCGGFE